MVRTRGISPQTVGVVTSNVMITSVVEKAGNVFLAGNNRTCSDGGSREDRGGNGMPSTEDSGCSKKPLCNGSR